MMLGSMYLKRIALTLAACLLLFVFCSVLPAEILTPQETHQLVDMLNTAGFDSTDVNFFKDWDASTKFKLDCQVDALNNPWKFITLLDDLKATSALLVQDSLAFSQRPFYVNQPDKMTEKLAPYLDKQITRLMGEQYYIDFIGFSKKPKQIFTDMESSFGRIVNAMQAGFWKFPSSRDSWLLDHRNDVVFQPKQNKLSVIDSLSFWLQGAWQESEDSLVYKLYNQQQFPGVNPDALTTETAIKWMELLNFSKLGVSWIYFERDCLSLEQAVRKLKFTNKKPIYKETKWGTMIIGGTGDDRYYDDKRLSKSPVCLIIEPGGNDVYDCSLFADRTHPFYIVLDLKGNDIYRNTGIAKEQSVNLGCGWLHDFEGDDIYQGGDFAFSSLLGFQALIDDKGNDTYTSGIFSQAAAMFGISVLQDNEGNDTYTATEFAQGMGGTKGLGLLLDGKGNDVYYCGGKYLHEPLAPFDYRSMGQGFGFGFRPDLAGGIGILYDGEGNDRYSGGVYAQGVAYWYAIGALFDEKGNDYYDAVYYPQGSGIHLANGALIDMEGEDHYYSKHGPGQGNGHDWSVGVFVDKKGNDQYSIEGGNGLGLTNSVGIFVDSEGDDKYEQRNTSNYGFANTARETGGLGLFLDAGGKDSYPDSLQANNKTWQNGTYGIGRDVELNKPVQTKMEELAEQSVADVDSLASIAELFDIASEWEVGSAAKRVKLAREYLLKREAEAVPYAIKMKMNTKSSLEYRTLSELAKKSSLMKTSLYEVLHDADSLKVKNSIALIAEQGDSLSVDSLAVFLAQNKYIPTVLSALGFIKSPKSLELIMPWLQHQTEKYRYIAARSLKVLNSKESIAELKKMSNDSSFLIKAMVRQLLQSEAKE